MSPQHQAAPTTARNHPGAGLERIVSADGRHLPPLLMLVLMSSRPATGDGGDPSGVLDALDAACALASDDAPDASLTRAWRSVGAMRSVIG